MLFFKVLDTAGLWNMVFYVFVVFAGAFYLVNLTFPVVALAYYTEVKIAAMVSHNFLKNSFAKLQI